MPFFTEIGPLKVENSIQLQFQDNIELLFNGKTLLFQVYNE
jgi:hypothetical protein